MTDTFVGWIPNVAGRLSFSHIGQTRHPKPCKSLNEDSGRERMIICAQKRPLSDALLAPAYLRFVYSYESIWHFVLIAKSCKVENDERSELDGTVYVFTRDRWLSETDGASLRDVVSDAIVDGEAAFQQEATANQFATEGLDALKAALKNAATYSVKCIIKRDGVTYLTPNGVEDRVLFSRAINQTPESIDDRAQRYLTNQVYFFLKDICHTHQHHHNRADTITSAHKDDAEYTWMRETQYGIHRRVVEKRRMGSPTALYEALGLMAYMASFDKISKTYPESSARQNIDGYNLSAIEQSAKANVEGKRWSRIQFNIIASAGPALFVALLSAFKGNEFKGTLFYGIAQLMPSMFPSSPRGMLSFIAVLLVLFPIYGVVDFKRQWSLFKSIAIAWSRRRQIITYGMISSVLAIIFIAVNTVTALDGLSTIVAWTILLAAAATPLFGVKILPYLYTIPDLMILLRHYPDRPMLYSEGDTEAT